MWLLYAVEFFDPLCTVLSTVAMNGINGGFQAAFSAPIFGVLRGPQKK